MLRCRNATQTSVVLEWDPIELATADLVSLSLYRNGQKAGNIPRPLQMHSTKISGLAVDAEYTFHLVLRTSAGTRTSEKVTVRTHKMTDLSGITITTGIMPAATRDALAEAVERIGAKIVDAVRIDTTHFVTTEGRGTAWEKAVETNIPVVRPEWVDACEKNGRILGVTKFYLDAMRPGPPSEESRPSPPAKNEPAAPPPPPQKDEEPAKKEENKDEDEDDEEEEEDKTPAPPAKQEDEEEEDDDEPQQKVKSPHPDDQKMRLEDKTEQKVALRPSTSKKSEAKEDEDAEEEDDKETKAGEKAAASPDGASFQEVEL